MLNASPFDQAKFASIMKAEVESFASELYGGASSPLLGKAFAFWCIKNISPRLDKKEIEFARAICESHGPGDDHIDGAWVDGDTLYLLQAKYSASGLTVNGEDFRAPSFSAEGAEQLEEGYNRLHQHIAGKPASGAPSGKLVQLAKMYEHSLKSHMRVSLVVTISGVARKGLSDKVDQINGIFNGDRAQYPKHYCYYYDIDKLNEIVSNNLAEPPDPVHLEVLNSFEMKNPDGSVYAIACTVDASELCRVREQCGFRIYHSNFRYLLTRGGVARPKIEKTLEDPADRRNFWRYNNGITIACETITPVPPTKFEIKGLQVVNGLQTIETLFENRDKKGWFEDVKLLVRVIPTKGQESTAFQAHQLEERIAEFSNSQTPIRARDLRSNDSVQIEIQRVLLEVYGLEYVRKQGELSGLAGRPSRDRVDNEEAAMAALSFWYGQSYEAKHNRRLIFERSVSTPPGYYDTIFNDNTTPLYILLPYLFYEDAYYFIAKVSDRILRGTYRSLDLLALAVVGDAFKQWRGLGSKPKHSKKALDILKFEIEVLRRGPSTRKQRLWKIVFKTLRDIAERRRRSQAKREGVKLEEVSLLNIISRIKYSDPQIRKDISKRSETRQIRKILSDLPS